MLTNVKKLGVKGFSLVELMVVVAIIGILAAVAVPQYKAFQNKARQSESKVSLGALATAEEAFKVENGSYISCVEPVGFLAPTGSLYNYGFAAGLTSTYFPSGNTAIAGGAIAPAVCSRSSNNGLPVAGAVAPAAAAAFTAVLPVPAANAPFAAAQTFTAASASNAVLPGAAAIDIWTIDQSRTLINRQSGIN